MLVTIAAVAMLLFSPPEGVTGLPIASGVFVIQNQSDEPLCVAADVTTGGIHSAAFDLRTASGEVQPVYRQMSTSPANPLIAPSWLMIPPRGRFSFESNITLPSLPDGDSVFTAARLSYWSLPCDFVLETYVGLDPNVDDEASLRARERADRLVDYGRTDWAEIATD
tara:strand:+ start:616 stop:1116 length:501 start_codon:yes stop_codon:yes gene_type:complete